MNFTSIDEAGRAQSVTTVSILDVDLQGHSETVDRQNHESTRCVPTQAENESEKRTSFQGGEMRYSSSKFLHKALIKKLHLLIEYPKEIEMQGSRPE
ncbi:MAG: hypothetical protein HYZ21_10080 [Chloroflexi bacterium]|nr:hypothetical protein [Chloroflexota bacterium]